MGGAAAACFFFILPCAIHIANAPTNWLLHLSTTEKCGTCTSERCLSWAVPVMRCRARLERGASNLHHVAEGFVRLTEVSRDVWKQQDLH